MILIDDLYDLARVTVTVDGGTHRWLKYLEGQGIDLLSSEHRQYVPDLITGDMDSCSLEMIDRLRAIGSTIVKTPDQSHTDYTKALQQLAQYTKNAGNINVILQKFVALAFCNQNYNYMKCMINNIVGSWVKYTCLQKRREGLTTSSATLTHCTRVTSSWEM